MADIHERLARLTPEQRAALEARLLGPPAAAGPPTAAPGPAGSIPVRDPGAGPAPLTSAQERMWFLQRFDPTDTAYTLHLVERLRGPLDVGRLRAAVDTVVARHEVLRTGFPMVDGAPLHRVDPDLDLSARVLGADGVADARRIVDGLVGEPFDPQSPPLARIAVVRLASDDHVLAVVLHHLCGDGWSLGVLAGDLSAAYRGDPLPPLPVTFADVAAWQRRQGADPDAVRRARDRIADAPALALPTDRPRPAVRSSTATRATRRLGAALTADLDALARSERATLFMTLLAGYEAVLSRHSGQSAFCVGSPMANRDRPELRPLVGCLTETLVLRADVGGDPTFRELLRRVRADALDAFAERDVPLDALVASDGDRDTGRTPLFQAMFNLQPARTGLLDLPGVEASPWPVTVNAVKSDVDLDVNRCPDDLELEIGASATLFDAGFAERLTGHLATLLAAAAADPDRPVSQLPLLDEAGRRAVLAAAGDGGVPCPAGRLDELAAAQAARTPDATAVIAGGRRLTYRDLVRRANGLAHRIRAAGARPGDAVAVLLPRDEHLVVALLAVLTAGCHYVPLEPAHPPARLRDLVADAGPTLILAHEPVADLPTLDPRTASAADGPPDSGGSADDLAYLIHTSGSTGRPKGVRVPHRGVVNLVADFARTPGFGPADRFLFLTSVSFDIAALEVFTPLLTGGAVVVAPDSSVRASDSVSDLIRDCGVTVVQAPPSVLAALLPRLPAGLPRVISGGERLPADLADRLLDRVGELWNFYGPTETTIWSTRARVRRGAPVTIGRPAPPARRARARRAGGAGAGRLRRRVVAGRRGRRRRLPPPRRPDRGAVPGRPVRRRRLPPLPDRRPGAPARGRRPGVRRPDRRAGEGRWGPRRAGGDRGRAGRASRCRTGRRRAPRRPARRLRARRLRQSRGDGRRPARSRAFAVARGDDAGRDRGRRRLSRSREREARSGGAAARHR